MRLRFRKLSIAPALFVAMLAAAQVDAQVVPGKTGTHMGIAYNALIDKQMLKPAEFIKSPNGIYTLRYQANGHLVLLKGTTQVWSSWSPVTAPATAAYLICMAGRVDLSRKEAVAGGTAYLKYWSTCTNTPGAFLAVQDDGNLVLYGPAMQVLWDKSRVPPPCSPSMGTYGITSNVAYNAVPLGFSLKPGESFRSPNGTYKLLYQTDGNLVILKGTAVDWQTGKTTTTPGKATFQTDGNLVTTDASGAKTWSAVANVQYGDRLALQNDGNLVIYRGNDVIWARR